MPRSIFTGGCKMKIVYRCFFINWGTLFLKNASFHLLFGYPVVKFNGKARSMLDSCLLFTNFEDYGPHFLKMTDFYIAVRTDKLEHS